MIENMHMLGSLQYICWTQAGWVKACRTVKDIFDDYETEIKNYPTKYPCVVTFSNEYEGYHYWYAICTPLDKAIGAAKFHYENLVSIDQKHREEIQRSKNV